MDKKIIKYTSFFVLSFLLAFISFFIYNNFLFKDTIVNTDEKWITYLSWSTKPYTWEYKSYYLNSTSLKEKWYFEDWKKNWLYITYFPNWKINTQTTYLNNIKNWEFIQYDEDWNLRQKSFYKNWKLDWKSVNYFPNWQIEEQVNYVNDILEWEKKSYYENWNLRLESTYKNGLRNWNEKTYTQSWTLLNEYSYLDEKMLSWNIYHSNWKLYREVEMSENWIDIIVKKEFDENWKKIIDIDEKIDVLEAPLEWWLDVNTSLQIQERLLENTNSWSSSTWETN